MPRPICCSLASSSLYLAPLCFCLTFGSVLAPGIARAQSFADPTAPAQRALSDDSRLGLTSQSAQIRARLQRLRELPSGGIPRLESTMSLSNDQLVAPLRPGTPSLAPKTPITPSSVQRVNTYFAGHLHTSAPAAGRTDLRTDAATLGGDFAVDENWTVGVAATRLQNDRGRGQAVAAYASVRPVEAIHIDATVATGNYASRAMDTTAAVTAAAEGVARGYSVQVSHPRRFAGWSVMPFGRYERIESPTDHEPGAGDSVQPSQSMVAIGGVLATAVGTPLGTLRPQVLVELQRERTQPAGAAPAPIQATHGLVGMEMTTRVSREVSAFAESQIRQEQGGGPSEKRAMVGLRLLF